MSESLMIFIVSFFVGLIGVALPCYMLHLLRMRKIAKAHNQVDTAIVERMLKRQAEAERHCGECDKSFEREEDATKCCELPEPYQGEK